MTKTKTFITRSEERMQTKIDWLDARHSFSFGRHYDPDRMGFGPLRVVNEDRIAPSGGFAPHPHSDMEIVTILLDGRLQHRDSMGNGRVIEVGEIQYMSAGSGVTHSEFNPSSELPAHLMQIWIEPNALGLEPRYADQPLVGAEVDEWSLVLSPDGREGSMAIRQDVELRTVRLTAGERINYRTTKSDRGFWVFVIEGSVALGEETLSTGDSIAVSDADSIQLATVGDSAAKVMVFDLPL